MKPIKKRIAMAENAITVKVVAPHLKKMMHTKQVESVPRFLVKMFLPIIALCILFAANNNTALANCNPYYGNELTPPSFLYVYDTASNNVILTITSTAVRTDMFTIYKTESGITTTLGTTNFETGSSATFTITPSDPPVDINIEVNGACTCKKK